MSGYTEGPWVKIGGGIYQADHVGRREIVHGSGIKGQTPEERAANAALMAAAPEMLEACKLALDYVHTEYNDGEPGDPRLETGDYPALDNLRDILDGAIAKARGHTE